MQTKGLYFIKVQKSPAEDWYEEINEQMQKIPMKIKVELQTTKYLVFSMVLKEKMSSV